jgi:predicted lipoprotein with Yx(FWY)xxD motif
MTTIGKTIVWLIVLALVVWGGWYLFSTSSTTEVAPSGENQAVVVEENTEPVVKVATDATLGDYLVAANGMTLYLYTKDAANTSNCSGECLVKWPAYSSSSSGPFTVGAGVTGLVAAITRADGSLQLTYKGVPLYFWQGDIKPGDTTGQNVGEVWFVVKP